MAHEKRGVLTPNSSQDKVVRFLRKYGIVDRQIPIRSSSYRLLRACPRAFLHRARHGLIDKSGRPDALQMGTYFHIASEALLRGLTGTGLAKFLQDSWNQQTVDWVREAGILNMDPPTQTDFDIQRDKFRRACNWAVTAWSISSPDLSRFKVIGTEMPIRLRLKGLSQPIVIKLDALLLDQQTMDLYIFDAKTTSYSPHVRMLVAPLDFQSLLYPYTMQHVVQSGALQQRGVPATARLAGFIHWVIQKPQLRYLKTTEKNDGPDAAMNELLARDAQWLRGEGEFHHLSVERSRNDVPVQMSMIPFNGRLMKNGAFLNQLHELDSACSRPGHPDKFPPCGDHLLPDYPGASVDPLLPLYEAHDNYAAWPRIVSENFAVQYRDDREPEPSLDVVLLS